MTIARMKSFFSAALVGLIVVACTKTDRSAVLPKDPNWIRLEAPTGGQAMDVAGSIDSVLFIATTYAIYKTSDAGRSWERIRSDHTGPQGLYLRRDTLWRLTSRGGTLAVKTVSGRFAEYTADGGKTWKPLRTLRPFSTLSAVPTSTHRILSARQNMEIPDW